MPFPLSAPLYTHKEDEEDEEEEKEKEEKEKEDTRCAFELEKELRPGPAGFIRWVYPIHENTPVSEGRREFTFDEERLKQNIEEGREYRGLRCGRADFGCSPAAISKWVDIPDKGKDCQCVYCIYYCGKTSCDCVMVALEVLMKLDEP